MEQKKSGQLAIFQNVMNTGYGPYFNARLKLSRYSRKRADGRRLIAEKSSQPPNLPNPQVARLGWTLKAWPSPSAGPTSTPAGSPSAAARPST
jgi:hypothetical protein